jgi:enoyl-CoA hydratase/carnithine racemase
METCGKPVVAAINGAALGGGLELCLAAHRRIVADDPRIKLGLPEATLGLLPGGGGTQRLARLIGVTASMPLLMEGKQLRPDAAKKAGFVDEIVPAAELMAAARAWLLGKPVSTQPWDAKGYKVPGGGVDDGTVLQTFMVANAMLLAKTQGNYPAGRAILSCLYEGLAVDIDAGLLVEKRYFVQLLLGPVAGAMIRTLFLSMQEANKLARRPAGVPRRKPARIGILGAGLMGAGVAFVAAGLGIEVVILDRSREAAEAAWTYATQRLDKQISRGQSTPAQKEALLGRIHPTADYADLAEMYARSRSEGFGPEVQRRILVGTYVLSAGYYDAYYLKAQQVRRRIADDFAAAFAQCDIIAGPIAPTVAYKLGEKTADPVQMYLGDVYTTLVNLAGLPALSLPCGFGEGGMPVGLQLIGGAFSEARLLNVAHRFQQATDHHLQTPGGAA